MELPQWITEEVLTEQESVAVPSIVSDFAAEAGLDLGARGRSCGIAVTFKSSAETSRIACSRDISGSGTETWTTPRPMTFRPRATGNIVPAAGPECARRSSAGGPGGIGMRWPPSTRTAPFTSGGTPTTKVLISCPATWMRPAPRALESSDPRCLPCVPSGTEMVSSSGSECTAAVGLRTRVQCRGINGSSRSPGHVFIACLDATRTAARCPTG